VSAVRLILEALISFFPTDPKGAVGSLDWTPQERRRLAAEVSPACLMHPVQPPKGAGDPRPPREVLIQHCPLT
jgi:hypothetical protein